MVARTTASRLRSVPSRPPLASQRIGDAFVRLARQRALQTLVRGALPPEVLRRLLKHAMPRSAAKEMPPEVWSSLAVAIGLESPVFGVPLGQALHDRLAWDRDPADLDGWWRLVVDKPLEALWMAALSESRPVRKEFAHIVEHCLENYRSSPACAAPSWEFVEGLLEVQAQNAHDLREAEKGIEEAERKAEADRQRLEELRDELKRLRRETSELRGEKAGAERRAEALAAEHRAQAAAAEARPAEELERRLRKAEKEREHLFNELARLRQAAAGPRPEAAAAEPAAEAAEPAPEPSLSEDPNPRRRVLRQMLRKLFKKGKIGASHTHEDNVYRGVVDHEKGIAKEAIDLLYREGLLVPKPTATDPHVSLSPDRVGEIRAIIAGRLANPRLQRWAES
jgi:hypothetical protein